MPRGLARFHGGGNLHFITTSCYRREPRFQSVRSRNVFLEIFEQVRKSYGFLVFGFVVMPEHIHILISEPKRRTIPVVVQVLKQRVAVRLLGKRRRKQQRELWETPKRRRFWQRRYYDFNVYSNRKASEKLHYMHWNPVRRGLVTSPELWHWSSSRAFEFGEVGMVKLNWQERVDSEEKGAASSIAAHPPKTAEGRAPTFWELQPKTKTQTAR